VTGTPIVVDALPAQAVAGAFTEHPVLGAHTGTAWLEQSVLEGAAGASATRATEAAEEVLFVLSGRGELRHDGGSHPLEPEAGVYVSPGQEYELAAAADADLRIVSVRVPDPVPEAAGAPPATVVRRLSDQAAQEATADREFRIVSDPNTGLRSATHFVGYIPTARAPDHFHTYDEVIYVLEGEGTFHAAGASRPLRPGTCIALPARTIHCLENTGRGVMRVVAVFRPAGSPAAAYYPDGTLAYKDISGSSPESQ
jgi:mannose-6-phosphate isomerase-like protein (cupin superfamily)